MTMTEDAQRRRRNRKMVWLALAALAALLIVLVVPPLVSISRYKVQITQLMSASLGRPVRLSSVELQLLPRPGFVLTDLTVEEDPGYGAEPVLHANSVTADIRLLPLWRGRLEISRVSVDEASLNLVRTREGRWNLDSIFRSAAAHSTPQVNEAGASRTIPLPYLEATNSRINIKNGLEKLPFSLVDADISFWQENPGDWRLRVRGQPARTDVSLGLADTGEVRLEASLHRAPLLRQMPVHVDMEWREAQLGQLSRLLIGSDPGWRGDLTADLHLDGTAESAQVKTQLRATGVHRAEFAPADPLDFDANCAFVYHYVGRSLEDLKCDSPLGDGHIQVAGDLPETGQPRLSVELQRISTQAGLDLLRTMRSGLDEGLEAKGTITGKLTYDPGDVANETQKATRAMGKAARTRTAKALLPVKGPLAGSLIVEGFALSGGGLSQPIQIPKITLDPAPFSAGQAQALTASVEFPAGGAEHLAMTLRLARSGYQVTMHGSVSFERMRELAHLAGISHAETLDALAGAPSTLDLNGEGPWLPTPEALFGRRPAASTGTVTAVPSAEADASLDTDRLSGTLVLHNANWKPNLLASQVEIPEATLHLGGPDLRWDPVEFAYGPVKGAASLQIPLTCEAEEPCPPRLEVHFAELDIEKLQAAFLGARKPDTLLSTLIARLTPSQSPVWPRLEATLRADSLALGPVTLHDATAALHIQPTEAEVTSLDANLLGGKVHVSGTVTSGTKPLYSLEGDFDKLGAPAVCQMLGLRCVGGVFNGNGKLDLTGFTAKDLAASAKGTLHFEWRHGAVRSFARPSKAEVPLTLAQFDRWTADAKIADGAVTLTQNQVQQGSRRSTVEASIPFGVPLRVTFTEPMESETAKR